MSAGVNITAEDLKSILKEVVSEARKHVPTEREQRDIEQQQKERAANAQDVKAQIANRKAFMQVCEHKQDMNRDQSRTAMVFVNQDFPNAPGGGRYLVCQQCGVKVTPGPAPKDAHPDYTYDTALFNRHFQMLRFD